MAFAEQLLSWKSEDGEGRAEDEPDTIPTSVLLQVVELLGEARHPRDRPGKLLGGGHSGLEERYLSRAAVKWAWRTEWRLDFHIHDLQDIVVILKGGI